jgi:hypothetical protein
MRTAVRRISLDTGCILEAPSEQMFIDYLSDIGPFMIWTGDVDAVAHHAVLQTHNGDLDMGALVIHH